MEIGVLGSPREIVIIFRFFAAAVGIVLGAICLMASFASNNSNNERVLFGRGGLFIALFCGIAATIFLGLGVFKYEAGNCFSSLPNKTFAVEMASYYREGSVYIVAEGKISGGATDLTRRCAIIKQGGDKEVVDFPGGFVGPGKYLLVIEKHATATRDEHAGEVKAVKKTWQTYTFVPVP